MGACAVSLLGHDAPGSAGASGAAFGIVAMTMALRWKMLGSWAAFSADPWVRRLGGTLALWMVLGTFMNFDNYAHGGGFATGALLGAVLLGGKMSLSARRAALGAFVVALALLLASAAHRWQGETSVWEGARASSGRGI
jgi:hypothetical protein